MKKLKYLILGFVSLLSVTSCDKFLTVNPKTEMSQDKIFSTESGFKDALTGVYIQMKENNAYGQAMTMTTMEHLISNWDVKANSTEEKLGLYDYEDAGVQNTMAAIYAQEYKIIASINSILAQIDTRKNVFVTPGLYEMIKGECLALRAYCHFDVLRLFGPLPSHTTATPILPYVKVISKTPNPQLTYSDFKIQLLQDLNDAALLLKDDPIKKFSLSELQTTDFSNLELSDHYMSYRYLRMNYYGIKALEARAYLWFNDPANAYAAAKEVIQATNSDSSPKFRLGLVSDLTSLDFSLTCEQIFGLNDWNLYNKFGSLFANGTLKKGISETTVKTQLYGNTGTDIRESNLWTLIVQGDLTKTYVYLKYYTTTPPLYNQIPMLRISEMYLIAIETAPLSEAQALWTIFRTSRNIPTTTLPADPALIQTILMPEYRKEFYAEGQAFFMYKRINAPKENILWSPATATINYVVPLPQSELVKTY